MISHPLEITPIQNGFTVKMAENEIYYCETIRDVLETVCTHFDFNPTKYVKPE